MQVRNVDHGDIPWWRAFRIDRRNAIFGGNRRARHGPAGGRRTEDNRLGKDDDLARRASTICDCSSDSAPGCALCRDFLLGRWKTRVAVVRQPTQRRAPSANTPPIRAVSRRYSNAARARTCFSPATALRSKPLEPRPHRAQSACTRLADDLLCACRNPSRDLVTITPRERAQTDDVRAHPNAVAPQRWPAPPVEARSWPLIPLSCRWTNSPPP